MSLFADQEGSIVTIAICAMASASWQILIKI